MSTCHLWMLAAGCKYCENVKHYFTDNHNRADVIEYRDKYNEEREKIAKRQPLWYKTKYGKSVHVDFLSEKLYVEFRKSHVEMGGHLHHDFSALTDVQKHSLTVNCKYVHTIETCKC